MSQVGNGEVHIIHLEIDVPLLRMARIVVTGRLQGSEFVTSPAHSSVVARSGRSWKIFNS